VSSCEGTDVLGIKDCIAKGESGLRENSKKIKNGRHFFILGVI